MESSKSGIFNIHRVNYDETEGAVVQLPLLTDPTVVFKVVEGEESWLRKQDGCKIIVAVSSNPVGWLLAQVPFTWKTILSSVETHTILRIEVHNAYSIDI